MSNCLLWFLILEFYSWRFVRFNLGGVLMKILRFDGFNCILSTTVVKTLNIKK